MQKTFSDPAATPGRITLNGPTMGTRWSVTLDAPPSLNLEALQADLAAAVQRVDEQMSPWKPHSDLVRFNHAPVNEWVSLSDDILEVLDAGLQVQGLSGGAFSPCVGALVDAWGFGAARQEPDPQEIRQARQATPAATDVSLDIDQPTGRARKRMPCQIDLCGIAKGYAVDRMVQVLQSHGVAHALAALDGELRAVGTQANGSPWSVAVEHPDTGRRSVHGVLALSDLAVATSGDYRHYLDVGGTRLAHTMDPRRSAPVNNAIASVTVLAPTCMQADAWATALLVTGLEEGLALAQRMGIEVLFMVRRPQGLMEAGLGRFGQTAG